MDKNGEKEKIKFVRTVTRKKYSDDMVSGSIYINGKRVYNTGKPVYFNNGKFKAIDTGSFHIGW